MARAIKIVRGIFDHNPIIDTRTMQQQKHLEFRFELFWRLKDPEFFKYVKLIWDKPVRAKTTFDRT